MEAKKVIFDGKDLEFEIGGIVVTNGCLPEIISISGEYVIDSESLGKLIPLVNENKVFYHVTDYSSMEPYPVSHIYSKDSFVEKVFSDKRKLNEKLKAVLEELKKEKENYAHYVQLIQKVKKYNNFPWFKRIFNTIKLSHKDIELLSK